MIDGGSLLQKIPWPKAITFGAICNQYSNFLLQKCHTPIVVFDGYSNDPSTKGATHFQRTKGTVGTRIRFSNDTPFKSSKESFLTNTENKPNILLLGEFFIARGISVVHARDDADSLIVQTAIALHLLSTTRQ